MKKEFIFSSLMILLSLIFSIFLIKSCNNNKELEELLKRKTEEIHQEMNKVDSLYQVIDDRDKAINSLKDSVEIREKIVYKEVEKIHTLSIDSNICLLKSNLEKYGELTKENDTLPTMTTDSIIQISENNLKDMNIIVAKYEGELDINKYQQLILVEDSSIISEQRDIILSKDIIISKQDSIFELNMKRLEKDIKKEKLKCGLIGTSVGVVVGSILTGVIVNSIKR